jgi:MFS family permease
VAVLAGNRSAGLAVALLTCHGVFLAVTITTGIVYRQETAPEHIRSRVMTVGRMIAWGGQPFGAAAAGLIAHLAGVQLAYLAAVGLLCLATAIASRIPRQRPPATFGTP